MPLVPLTIVPTPPLALALAEQQQRYNMERRLLATAVLTDSLSNAISSHIMIQFECIWHSYALLA